ncbi:MAG: O-antigen ligase family protein [Pseudomonadota bacterium]
MKTTLAPRYRRLALFLGILCSGGILLFPRIPMLVGMLVLCLMVPRFKLSSRLEPVFFLLSLIFVFALMHTGGANFEALAVRYANFLAGVLLLNVYLQEQPITLTEDLYVILKWFAIQCLVTVVLATAAPFLFMDVPYLDMNYQSVGLVFTYHATIDANPVFVRPDGFFYEPGIYQIYLNLYLYLALYVYKNTRHSILALVAVGATQSTTGVVIAGILLGVYSLKWLGSRELMRSPERLLIGLALVFPLAVLLMTNVNDKLTGDSRGSAWARQYDLITGVNVVMAHPLMGIGFDHGKYRQVANNIGFTGSELSRESTTDRDSSNGILYLLYSIGIPLSIPFLIGMFRQHFFPNKFLVGMLLFVSLQSEAIIYTPFILLLIFSGLLRRAPQARPRQENAELPAK